MKWGVLFILSLGLILSACCSKGKPQKLLVNTENGVWLPDSLWNGFKLKSSVGMTMNFINRFSDKGYITSISGKNCNQIESQDRKIRFESTNTKNDLELRHSGGFNGENLVVRIDNVVVEFIFSNHSSFHVGNGSRELNIAISELDSMLVDGVYYKEIMKFDVIEKNLLGEHEASVIYIAKKYGIVRYDEKGGIFWELVY